MWPSIHRALSTLNDRFTTQLVRDDDALLVQFRMLNDAEEKSECLLFDRVAGRLPPKLAALVRRHEADELRHVSLTRQALAILGDRPEVVDRRADLVAVMDAELGNLLSAEHPTDADLARAYLFLHALERRMCAQLGQMVRSLRETRPELAAIAGSIRADELRHVTWCEVIAFELGGRDPVTHTKVKAEMIRLEARVFARVTHHNLNALLDVGLAEMTRPERAFWRAISWALLVVPGVPIRDDAGELAARGWAPAVA